MQSYRILLPSFTASVTATGRRLGLFASELGVKKANLQVMQFSRLSPALFSTTPNSHDSLTASRDW